MQHPFRQNSEERSIWWNFVLALFAVPLAGLIVLIPITLVGVLDDAIAKLQAAGYWWVVLIGIYILSFIYFVREPHIRRNRARRKVVDGLILYLREQLATQKKPDLSEKDVGTVRELLLQRVAVWGHFDPELWARYFPDEEYSERLFGIVDHLMVLADKIRK